MTVNPELRFEVSAWLRADYSNGRSYYPLHGERLAIPTATRDHPDPVLLRWHNETILFDLEIKR